MDGFILAALASALCYGVSDFAGGKASTRTALATVLVISECTGALTLWVAAWYSGDTLITGWAVGVAALAGILGTGGVAFLYRGIADGHTAVTVPVSAVMCALMPVLYGISSHGIPSARICAGIGLGVVAIVLTSWSGEIRRSNGLWHGVIAGCLFGLFFVCITIVGRPDVYLAPLAVSRTAALLITIPWALWRPAPRPGRRAVGLAVLAGLADVMAGWTFMLSAQAGRVDIAGVLASLYPAVTVTLAAVINHEQIARPQRWGLLVTVIATALIAG